MPNEGTKLGEGVGNGLKSEVNQGMLQIGTTLIETIVGYATEKIKNFDVDALRGSLKQLSDKDEKQIIERWSQELERKGLIPKGYSGLPDDLLIHNFRQEGYLDGLLVGHVVTMMGMAKLQLTPAQLLAVRDDVRARLFSRHRVDPDKVLSQYKQMESDWIKGLANAGDGQEGAVS